MKDSEIDGYLQKAIQRVPLEQFIGLAEDFGRHLIKEDQAQYSLFDESFEDEN